MNGKIDASGFLWIERAGVMKKQRCPFNSSVNPILSTMSGQIKEIKAGVSYCGDWCPLFGEPSPVHDGDNPLIELSLCHAYPEFDTFTDERKNAKDR